MNENIIIFDRKLHTYGDRKTHGPKELGMGNFF